IEQYHTAMGSSIVSAQFIMYRGEKMEETSAPRLRLLTHPGDTPLLYVTSQFLAPDWYMGQGQAQLKGEPWNFVKRPSESHCRGDGHIPSLASFPENLHRMTPVGGDVAYDSFSLTGSEAAIPLPQHGGEEPVR